MVLKELLDYCEGLDEHSLELSSSNLIESELGGYQIIIRGTLDEESKRRIQNILMRHQLSWQVGSMWRTRRSANRTSPDTFMVYRAVDEKM
jgi:hypothetical protein